MIAIRKMQVSRQHRHIAQGTTVDILVYVSMVGVTDVLYDPMYVPVITIYDPSGTVLVTDAAMTQLSTGLYRYRYPTTTELSLGLYTAVVKAIDDTEIAITEKRQVFKLAVVTTLATFTYLVIKDQDNALWYWYIASDNTLAVSSAIPAIAGKQALAISLPVVPSWLEINNPTPALRYVYPELTGDATVTAVQPAVGSGNVESPTLVGVGTGSFKIALNVSDEVILQTI